MKGDPSKAGVACWPGGKCVGLRIKRSGPEVIKPFSCSAQLSIKIELLISTEIAQIN